ncbi:hypothetical protein J14TS2_42440 [Bacillus sp. J14TS2]|uniref:SRPBCC domain-containing protein n=1 Tax=Bacillus sp. J14TS2 TaxID=2807188 RepID=UPI001B02915B|nr:SRPBCC domain-containing protein [Bacillus sp. J14TS2]GIN73769.1 hypothetical protein J14TS2_42440 [Bacillus sp. J14TS2]
MSNRRTDSASKVINSSMQTIYRAFLNPDSMISWLPPQGMTGYIDKFDPVEGGFFRIILTYEGATSIHGKTSENTDAIQGKFLELVPDKRIVQSIIFVSDDPAFSGEMIQSWVLEPVSNGTKVTVVCENVPEGVRKEDHDVGLNSTLENLAAFTE